MGTPSSMAIDHLTQIQKRKDKIEQFDYQIDGSDFWAEIDNASNQSSTTTNFNSITICLISWGSASAMVKTAAQQLRNKGHQVKVIAMRLIMPLQKQKLITAVADSPIVFVIEQNDV